MRIVNVKNGFSVGDIIALISIRDIIKGLSLMKVVVFNICGSNMHWLQYFRDLSCLSITRV